MEIFCASHQTINANYIALFYNGKLENILSKKCAESRQASEIIFKQTQILFKE